MRVRVSWVILLAVIVGIVIIGKIVFENESSCIQFELQLGPNHWSLGGCSAPTAQSNDLLSFLSFKAIGLTVMLATLLSALLLIYRKWTRSKAQDSRHTGTIQAVLDGDENPVHQRKDLGNSTEQEYSVGYNIFAGLVEIIPFGVFILDRELKVLSINAKGLQLVGFDTSSQFIGQPFSNLVDGDYRDVFSDGVRCTGNGEKISLKICLHTEDNNTRWVRTQIRQLTEPSELVGRFMVFADDR